MSPHPDVCGRQRTLRFLVASLCGLTAVGCGTGPDAHPAFPMTGSARSVFEFSPQCLAPGGPTTSDSAPMSPTPTDNLTPIPQTPAAESMRAQPVRPAPADLSNLRFASPLVIPEGGTYSGNWESLDPGVPAVTITTEDPVVIRGSHLRSRGHLIDGAIDGIDLTVIDSVGVGLNPSQMGGVPGRFVNVRNPRRILIEHNELNGTAGIRLEGYMGKRDHDTYQIRANRVTNVDGRMSTGNGFSNEDSDAALVQFVQFVEVQAVPGIEVSWNDVRNEPGRSRVEDVVSVYESSGTANNPISLQHNFIDGAYPADPASDQYTGGGIMLGDGPSAAHVSATQNIVLNTTNYGIAVNAGRDMLISGNHILATGLLPDGRALPAQNVGIYVWNSQQASNFGNVRVLDNVVRWERPSQGSRNDHWLPDVSTVTTSGFYDGIPTGEVINAAYASWLCQTLEVDIRIGPKI